MSKGKLINLLLIAAAVLVVVLSAFSVRLTDASGSGAKSGKGRCCCMPETSPQKIARE